MLHVDTQKVAHYLNVSEKKLRSKGVSSVSSRVCNLCDFVPSLTTKEMQQKLLEAFAKVYRLSPLPIPETAIDHKRVMALYNQYSSWEWKFGRKIKFSWEANERFDWGEIQMQLHINEGIIQDAILYSDALDADWIELLSQKLIGCRFEPEYIFLKLQKLSFNQTQSQILSDICSLMRQQNSPDSH